MASGLLATCAANSSGSVAGGIARAVSFHPRRMVSRSSAARMSRPPIGRSGCATAASSSRTSRSASASTLARSNRSVAYSSAPSIPAGDAVRAALLAKLSDKSNLALAVSDRFNAGHQPRQVRGSTGALFCNASITWNSGCRASERAGLRPPPAARTASPDGYRQQDCSRAPARSARGSSDCRTCRCAAPAY